MNLFVLQHEMGLMYQYMRVRMRVDEYRASVEWCLLRYKPSSVPLCSPQIQMDCPGTQPVPTQC